MRRLIWTRAFDQNVSPQTIAPIDPGIAVTTTISLTRCACGQIENDQQHDPNALLSARQREPRKLVGDILTRATHLAASTIVGDHITAMATRDHQFSVSSRCELLPYLLTLPLGLSRKEAKDLLRFSAVTREADGHRQARHAVGAGRRCDYRGGQAVPAASIERHGLKIVYLDDAVVVVDKRAGLLSMGSESEKERTAHRILNEHLKALTKSTLQQAFIVHRLDRETSGLMMFARSRALQATLQHNWKNVTKKYLAVVEGAPAKAEGTLRDNLVESKSLQDASRRARRRAGDHALSSLTSRSRQLAGRADARDRPQESDSRADGRPRPSDRWRSQVRRDDGSRAAPRAPFEAS